MNKLFILLYFLLFSIINLSAQVFDYIVAKDGTGTDTTITSAINKCPDNTRSIIFIKKGTYKEKVMIGSHSVASKKVISLIGEDAQATIIVWDDYNGRSIVYDGKTVTSGTPQSATLTVNANDFYAENLSIINTNTSAQAVAYYGVADRQTFKNCRFIGLQDTHYTKKGRRYYYYNCYIEGGVDYICAGGTCIFDSCRLYSVRSGGSITAPEDITAYTTVGTKLYYCGFIFRNCNLTAANGIEVYLGRPWQATSSSIFLNCKMDKVRTEGWSTWSGTNHLSSFFAEYNSMKPDGSPVDISGRTSWSYQLTKSEVDTYYTNQKIYSFVTTSTFDPFSQVISPAAPTGYSVSGNSVSWSAVNGVKGYVLYKNGVLLTITNSTQFTDITAQPGIYSIKSIGNLGQLSDSATLMTGISQPENENVKVFKGNNTLKFSEPVSFTLFDLKGNLILSESNLISETEQLPYLLSGVYLIKLKTAENNFAVRKIVF